MATTTAVRSRSWSTLVLLVGLIQLARGEPNAACKTPPTWDKSNADEECCKIPQVYSNETMQACMDSTDRSGKSQMEKSCVFASCIMRENKLLKPNGQFDVDRIRAHIKDSVQGSDEWKTLMEKIVLDECLPMVEKDTGNVLKQMKSSVGDCDPVPAVVMACAAAKFYSKCPSKDWTGSKTCDEWKTFFSKCGNSLEDLHEMYLQLDAMKLTDG